MRELLSIFLSFKWHDLTGWVGTYILLLIDAAKLFGIVLGILLTILSLIAKYYEIKKLRNEKDHRKLP